MHARLRVSNISKTFAVPVLQGINFELQAGEILGLVGENGAGKSTLINILCGLLQSDAGKLILDEQLYQPASSLHAMRSGVSLASQELSLIDELSIAENISLRALPTQKTLIQRKAIASKAKALLKKFALNELSVHQKVDNLSLAQKQLVELCKALSEPCKLLVLDEPSAALSQQQSDLLHRQIREMAAQGISIIYVSHRLDDILHVCDKVSVLRDGKLVQSYTTNDVTSAELIEQMSGGALVSREGLSYKGESHKSSNLECAKTDNQDATSHGEPLLEIKALRTKDLPYPVNLQLNSHEIVGMAGLAGAGRTEVLEAIFGLTPVLSGKAIRYLPEQINIEDTAHAVKLGVGMLSEDRKQQGIFSQQSLFFNAKSAALKEGNSKRFGGNIMSYKKQKRCVRDLFKKISVKFDNIEQDIEELSGGNQQKVLLARWLYAKTQVFLLDEPTRGIDSGAKVTIYEELKALKTAGAGCLVVSSEIEELFTICDRILVMSNRHVVGEMKRQDFNKETLLKLAFSKIADSNEVATQ